MTVQQMTMCLFLSFLLLKSDSRLERVDVS